MKLTITVDNFCTKQGLFSEWGYSAWLDTEGGSVMLDTGGILHVLTHNMSFLKLDPAKLSAVVLSHGHFDHTSGLIDMVRLAPQAKIYAGKGVDIEKRGDADAKRRSGGLPIASFPNASLINEPTEVVKNVFAFTVPQSVRNNHYVCCKNLWEVSPEGNIVEDNFLDDVSMAVKGKNGWSLLLGCSHAGLPNIMSYAQKTFGIDNFYMVVGGSHLCAVQPDQYPVWLEKLSTFNVSKWRLNHCTGFKAAAKMASYFDDVDWAGAGASYEL